ncbi:hypothetical protein JCM11251_002581 [Rhodosporidiobolus azoricus]
MSNNDSSRLPVVGSTFPTLLEFKIAAFTAAKNCSFAMSTFHSASDRSAILNCTGLGGKNRLAATGDKPCSCRIAAHRDGQGGFKVTLSSDQHSCTVAGQPESKDARAAHGEMVKRVAGLKKELEEAETQAATSSGDEDDGTTSSEDDRASYIATDNDDNDSVNSSSSTSRRAKRRLCQITRRAQWDVPTKTSLSEDINSDALPPLYPQRAFSSQHLTLDSPGTSSNKSFSLNHLASCFSALTRSTSVGDLLLFSASLLESGVSSIDALSALFTFEDGTLIQFIEEIKVRKGWCSGEALVLGGILDEAKRVFAAEKQ